LNPILKKDAQFFIEEEEYHFVLPKPLDPFEEIHKPPIELKPCLLVFVMLFSIMIQKFL
jgi:hypothetical protein